MPTVFLNYKAKLNQNEEKVLNFYKSSKIKQIDPNKLSPGVSWPKGTQKGCISSNLKSDYISRRPKKKKKESKKQSPRLPHCGVDDSADIKPTAVMASESVRGRDGTATFPA